MSIAPSNAVKDPGFQSPSLRSHTGEPVSRFRSGMHPANHAWQEWQPRYESNRQLDRIGLDTKRNDLLRLTKRWGLVQPGDVTDSTSDATQDLQMVSWWLQQMAKRDGHTANHMERVGGAGAWLARQMGLSLRDSYELLLGGWIHDIGKILPDINYWVKFKGELPDEGFQTIMDHPTAGAKLNSKWTPRLERLNPWVEGHHKRYDGGGYPLSLFPDVLPFSVRILTVADTIDAMVNRRFQRGREGGQRAMGGEEIRRALTGGSGSQFHPEVVREALKMSMFRQQGAASPEKCLVGGGLTSTR